MATKAIGDGPALSVRGLKLWRQIGESTFVSRIDGKAAVVDLKLLRTFPAEHAADVSVSRVGEKEDLEALGITPGAREIRVNGFSMVEVVPGILVGVGIRGGEPGVTATGAPLVVKAARELWEIEREEVFTSRMLDLMRAGKLTGLSALKRLSSIPDKGSTPE